MTSPALSLVVLLYVDADHTEDYERFESEATRIMAAHGGRIERRVGLEGSGDGGERPTEVHIVSFESGDGFEAYRRDPALQALAPLRESAMRRTVIWRGRDLPTFE